MINFKINKMKTIITAILSLVVLPIFSQAIKPKIMIVPSDPWMIENNYVTEEDEDGDGWRPGPPKEGGE